MTEILWVRHTRHQLGTGVLTGRMPGVHLSEEGAAQAAMLGERLAEQWGAMAAIYTGPLDRVKETAAPLAARLGIQSRVLPEIDEVDFGEWTGRSFEELEQMEAWQRWNSVRGWVQPPGGEMMLEVQRRAAAAMARMRDEHPGQTVVLFSHGDVIRAAMAHALGVHIDQFLRIEIGLGSVSAVRVEAWGVKVIGINGKWGEFGEG